ncbi:MAG: AhpC/TSA family protein [Cytophagales bacterium]|nr:MAG: AhpC/TSA family protein [Cytophagales bacterium]
MDNSQFKVNFEELKKKVYTNFPTKSTEENNAFFEDFQKELTETDIKQYSLKTGDTMPHFTLPNAHKHNINSQNLLDKKWLIIVFYRGAWCPFCNLYLKFLQRNLETINNIPARLVAISPQTIDNSVETINKNNLSFEVLSDTGSVVAKKFNLVYTVPNYLNEVYLKNGIDFQYYNSKGKIELPLPATYIIDQQGTIHYHFIEYDFTLRADVNEIIKFISQH